MLRVYADGFACSCWSHRQAVNLITATKEDPHTWTHDGDMSETFGLEPNFGCCTANFNQVSKIYYDTIYARHSCA